MSGLLKNVSKSHPRLLGSREHLQALAKQRPEAYARTVEVARNFVCGESNDDHGMRGKLAALSLVSVIENDAKLGEQAHGIVKRVYLSKPVRVGHIGFGGDCAQLAINYDLCHEHWTAADRARFYAYFDEVREKNVGEEPSVFHNGWYGMKHGGYILACLATAFENPRAEIIFEEVDRDYHTLAAPALKFAGDGGGFGEGYYTHYWTYDWMFAVHCLKTCAGIDYCEAAPEFYKNRAIAGMFEAYPPTREMGSRRSVACGDSGGRELHPERDKSLAANRMLISYYRDDPAHQAAHAFNLQTPKVSFSFAAYRDFLFQDPTVKAGDLKKFKLSHFSPGPGYVCARDSWEDDSAHLFFHCGRRFTSHQHLDMNHFSIFKYEELLGDGGAYDSFDSAHCTNYYLRTIAHNSILVHDPAEKFPAYIRAGGEAANDGGQKYPWVGGPWGHNGGAWTMEMWKKNPELGEIGAMVAYEDTGDYMYCAGDATRAYSSAKLECFTRQIVFLRPGVFVIFDRVRSTRPEFKKTFLLQAMVKPWRSGAHWTYSHGYGKIFIQTLLPVDADTKILVGDAQFNYDGKSFPFERANGRSPDCRIDISPTKPARDDYFLHVLTTTDYNVGAIPPATQHSEGDDVVVTIGERVVTFKKSAVTGSVSINGKTRPLADATLKLRQP